MTDPHAETLKAAAVLTTEALKFAQAARQRMAAAPKPVSQDAIKQAAAALVDHGWVPGLDKEAVEKYISDPAQALQALQNLAVKAATETNQDPRLLNGKVTNEKSANEHNENINLPFFSGASEADKMYFNRVNRYRRGN